jgi:prophage antirepressor-like protein
MNHEHEGEAQGADVRVSTSSIDKKVLDNQKVVPLPVRGTVTRRDLDGRILRMIHASDGLWFVDRDVCHALSLAPHKGSYAQHLRKLDDDEKRLVLTSALELENRSTLNVEASEHRAEGGAHTWLISEAGLYTVILRSRDATTPGTFAHRFRRWVTSEVLPEIRRSGGYTPPGSGDLEPPIVIPRSAEPVRYVVVAVPGQPPNVRRTKIEDVGAEYESFDLPCLAFALKTIEVWWRKSQIMDSFSGRETGFAVRQLEKAITNGTEIAAQYLGRPD